jgi:hypothetical protein
MKYYDYARAQRLIEEHKPTSASLGMAEDAFFTTEEVYENGAYLLDLAKRPTIGGIRGSHWATPVLTMEIEGEECTRRFAAFTDVRPPEEDNREAELDEMLSAARKVLHLPQGDKK